MFLHICLLIGCLKTTPLTIILSLLLIFTQIPIEATPLDILHLSTLSLPIARKLLKTQYT